MKAHEIKRLHELHKLVREETDGARERFPSNFEDRLAVGGYNTGLVVLMEAVGKMARCTNKMSLASTTAVYHDWKCRRREELVKAISILERLHLTDFEGMGLNGSTVPVFPISTLEARNVG